jgi:hypothetical protein
MLCCYIADPAIALLGGMQSLFEASMYSFVFLWTLAMSPNKEAIKHGLIFVNFMTACMAGSFLAGGQAAAASVGCLASRVVIAVHGPPPPRAGSTLERHVIYTLA